ncbi:MAG: hypothetical protein WEE89_05755 [Gemmatimonadota bacterium]
MKRLARASVFLGAALLAGCVEFDFLTPDLPESGAPAVFQANIYVDETGTFRLDGSLAPGLTLDGFRRTVRNDTIRVSTLLVPPNSVAGNGTRRYAFPAQLADPVAFSRPLTIAVPGVSDVGAVPPVFQWYGLSRVDGDSVIVARGSELVLRVSHQSGLSQPAPQIRQWFLELATNESSFRISGPGDPPDSLRIPPYWLPPASDGRVTAFLTYYVSGVYRPAPGDYLLILGASIRLRWNIRLQG